MTSFFKRLFGSRNSSASAPSTRLPEQADAQVSRFSDSPITVEDNTEVGMRGQLIHVLLRDVIRRHGLPPHWIECQILQVASRRRGPGMSVRLIIKHWDARLMQHLMAFQKAFQTDVERFEPKASQWLHGISWQIQPLNACSHIEMPDKAFWLSTPSLTPPDEKTPLSARAEVVPTAARSAFEATQPLDVARDPALNDIQRLFAIRDREIAQAGKSDSERDYAPTEPSALHRK